MDLHNDIINTELLLSFPPLIMSNTDAKDFTIEIGSITKQRFTREFFYDYISLFHNICESYNIHTIENSILSDILLWANIDCTYVLSFWINPQIIEETLCNISINCIDALSIFEHENTEVELDDCDADIICFPHQTKKYKTYSQSPIPDEWFINVIPYCHNQSLIDIHELIYHVTLRLQTKPTIDVKYYHLVICQYMADPEIYYINNNFIQWEEQKRICMGTDNEWLLCLKPRQSESQYLLDEVSNYLDVPWEDESV